MKKTSRFLFSLALLAAAAGRAGARETPPPADQTEEFMIKDPGNPETASFEIRWQFIPEVFGGYNQLISGYHGYKNLGNVGVGLWMRPVTTSPEEPSWYTNNVFFRVFAEWMPLQVPEGNYGLTEDLYDASAQFVYKFDEERDGSWIPFLGLGAGGYQDRLTLDTPASGKVTGTHSFFGLNASLGLFTPAMGPFRLASEARYHRIHEADNYWAQNVTYHVSLLYGFGAKIR
jgi:hypothetical protein